MNWLPGFELGPNDGEIRTKPREVTAKYVEPDDAELLREYGLDPGLWCVTNQRHSRWEVWDGRTLEAFKLTVKRRDTLPKTFNFDDINDVLRDYARPKKSKPSADDFVFFIGAADIQTGKIDNGGTESIIERFARIGTDIAEYVQREHKKVPALVLAFGGDCIEGIVSQGGKLATRIDLSVTEQVRVFRRLVADIIAKLAPLCDRMLVLTVGGNHDQPSRQFALTKPGTDSWAVEAVSSVADALADRKAYAHVQFAFPDDETESLTVDVGTEDHPLVIGLTHGHICGSNSNQVEKWFAEQAFGRQEIGEADLLVTGHWHSLRIENIASDRTWIQLPALDSGSAYWTNKHGAETQSGIVTACLHPGRKSLWSKLTVWS